jgi:replicative DNA helicase
MTTSVFTDAFNKNVLFSEYVELNVLYTLMDTKEAYDLVGESLNEDIFYFNQNKIILRAILDLAKSGKSHDTILVREWILGRSLDKESGGEKHFCKVIDEGLFASDIEDHVRLLHEYSVRRNVVEALESSLKLIKFEKKVDVSELAESCSKTIMEASQGSFSTDLFSDPESCVVSTLDRVINHAMHGTPTGFIGLDNHIGGIQKGDLVVIAAGSSGGKSMLAANIAVQLMDEVKKGALFYSMEMPKEQVTLRILCSLSSVPINTVRMQTFEEDQWARFQHRSDLWKKKPFHICAKGSLTVEEVVSMTKKKFRELNGLSCIVVDYIQLMRAEKSNGRTQDIDHITRGLKSLALALDIPVIALSQFNRSNKEKPTVANLRESGSIEQDADIIIIINHEDKYSELIVAKQRQGPRNLASRIVLNGAMGRFENPTDTWG